MPRQVTSRKVGCGQPVQDTYPQIGRTHVRKRFLLRGEDWACCLPVETFTPLDGAGRHVCGKQANQHVTMPEGRFVPGTGSPCAMACDRHGAWLRQMGGRSDALP